MQRTVTVGGRGQLTIPADIRRELDIRPRQKVKVSLENGRIIITREPADIIVDLTGCYKGTASPLSELVREHAEEVRRDEELHGPPLAEGRSQEG